MAIEYAEKHKRIRANIINIGAVGKKCLKK